MVPIFSLSFKQGKNSKEKTARKKLKQGYFIKKIFYFYAGFDPLCFFCFFESFCQPLLPETRKLLRFAILNDSILEICNHLRSSNPRAQSKFQNFLAARGMEFRKAYSIFFFWLLIFVMYCQTCIKPHFSGVNEGFKCIYENQRLHK
jgi:hypothetical protein